MADPQDAAVTSSAGAQREQPTPAAFSAEPPGRGASAAGSMAPEPSMDSAQSETLVASELRRGSFGLPDLQPLDKQPAAAVAIGGTAGSGLIIDGFIVPPHVLQALQVGSVQTALPSEMVSCIYAAGCACAMFTYVEGASSHQ